MNLFNAISGLSGIGSMIGAHKARKRLNAELNRGPQMFEFTPAERAAYLGGNALDIDRLKAARWRQMGQYGGIDFRSNIGLDRLNQLENTVLGLRIQGNREMYERGRELGWRLWEQRLKALGADVESTGAGLANTFRSLGSIYGMRSAAPSVAAPTSSVGDTINRALGSPVSLPGTGEVPSVGYGRFGVSSEPWYTPPVRSSLFGSQTRRSPFSISLRQRNW